MAASLNVASPNDSSSTSKASDKQNLFRSFKYIVANALAYTANYKDDPEEGDFINYLDDVVKTLPSNEQTVPVCASVLSITTTHYLADNFCFVDCCCSQTWSEDQSKHQHISPLRPSTDITSQNQPFPSCRACGRLSPSPQTCANAQS